MRKQFAILIIVLAEIFVLGHRSVAHHHQDIFAVCYESAGSDTSDSSYSTLEYAVLEDLVYEKDATSIIRLNSNDELQRPDHPIFISSWNETIRYLPEVYTVKIIFRKLSSGPPLSPHLVSEFLRGPPSV